MLPEQNVVGLECVHVMEDYHQGPPSPPAPPTLLQGSCSLLFSIDLKNVEIETALYIVHCALCIVHCDLCIVHCDLCIVNCPISLFNLFPFPLSKGSQDTSTEVYHCNYDNCNGGSWARSDSLLLLISLLGSLLLLKSH